MERRFGSSSTLVAQENPLDYSGGGGLSKPGSKRASGRFTVITSVLLDASVPLPTDADPDLSGSPVAGETVVYTPRMFSTRSNPLSSPLPTHSRTARSPSKASQTLPFHSRNNSNAGGYGTLTAQQSRSGRCSPHSTPDSSQRSLPPSSDAATSSSTPGQSPRMRPSTPGAGGFAQYPEGATAAAAAAAGHSTSATAAGRPTDALLHSTDVDEEYAHHNSCTRLAIHTFNLLCCFLTPSHHAHLSRLRREREREKQSSLYVSRHSARERRRWRHAAASTASKSRTSSDAGTSSGQLPTLPPPSLSRGSSGDAGNDPHDAHSAYWSDDEDSDLSRPDLEWREERRRGPCCERPCVTRGCQRTCQLSSDTIECCTVRRSACISVWTTLILVGAFLLWYYLATVRDHGWEWPPRTGHL
jgi:hypothetical protein